MRGNPRVVRFENTACQLLARATRTCQARCWWPVRRGPAAHPLQPAKRSVETKPPGCRCATRFPPRGRTGYYWHSRVGIRWERFQCRFLRLYCRRVTEPVSLWVACACPPEFHTLAPTRHLLCWMQVDAEPSQSAATLLERITHSPAAPCGLPSGTTSP